MTASSLVYYGKVSYISSIVCHTLKVLFPALQVCACVCVVFAAYFCMI